MTHRIFVKGNYLYVDKDGVGVIYRRGKAKVEIRPMNETGGRYHFYYDGRYDLTLNFSEIKQEDGNPWASNQAFIDWVDANTAVLPTVAGGGSGSSGSATYRNFRRTEDLDSVGATSRTFTCKAISIRFDGVGGKYQTKDVQDGEVIEGGGDLTLETTFDYERPPQGKVVFTEMTEL